MKRRFESLKIPHYLIALLIFLSLAILLSGFSIYHMAAKHEKIEKQSELSAIADLKVQQIENWRKERMGDAASIQNPIISRSIHEFLENPSAEHRQDILAWMISIRDAYHYENVILFDRQNKIRLSIDGKSIHVKTPYDVSAAQMISAPKIYFSGLHQSDTGPYIEQEISVPI